MSIAKKIKAAAFGVLLSVCCLLALSPFAIKIYAATPVDGEDGIYNVSYSIAEGGMVSTMLGRYMANPAVVEKIGNNYYLSVTQLSSSMENLSLNLERGKQVGYEITSDDGSNKTYRFTVSKENLSKGLPFSVYVSLRKETFSFTINLDLSGATRTGDIADSKTDRPGKFVPVISTTAGDEYEVARGQTFTIPSASAALGYETIEVSVSAYYVRNGEKTDIEITDNKLTLENAGEYHIVYRAESSQYTTLLGNPTYAEKDVRITSLIDGGSLAKLTDTEGILPENTMLIASRIGEDSTIYKKAAEKMAKISDRFQVFGVELTQADGSSVTPEKAVTIGLRVNYTYNRNEVEAYLLGYDGSLTKLSVSNGGSYVNISTDKTGTIIICVPGIAFVMPVWGYILISVGAVVLIAAAIVVTIVLVKKKKKKAKAA